MIYLYKFYCNSFWIPNSHLQYEMPMRGVPQTQVVLIQVSSESGQVLVLSADIRGQNQWSQLPLHIQTVRDTTKKTLFKKLIVR